MKKIITFISLIFTFIACTTTAPPQRNMIEEMLDAEYEPYLISGTGGITGQAFLTHQESGVVKA